MDPSYNNDFNGANPGGMTPVNMPVSSDTGDIVLTSGGEKKSKRWLVVIGLIMLVVAIVVFIILNSPFFKQSSGQLSAQGAFNKYSNYYLYGDPDAKNDSSLIENFSQTSFAKEADNEDTEARDVYFTNLRGYYDSFYNIYMKEIEEDKNATDFINNYRKKIDLLTYYNSGFDFDRQSIVVAYANGGDQGVEELIKTISAPYEKIGEIYGMNYYDLVVEYVNVTKDLIKMYDGFGCMDSGEINYMCASQKVNDQTEQLNNKISALYSDIRAILVNCQGDSFNDISKLRDRLESSNMDSQQEGTNEQKDS